MANLDFKPLPTDFQELLSAFNQRVEQCGKDLVDHERRHYNSKREEAVLYCFRHALDLAKGCALTAEDGLPDSLATLSRSLLESFFLARYVTMSMENAEEFMSSTQNELKRIARKNLNSGYATVFDKHTNEDRTKEFLASDLMKDIPKRISIEKIAELGGLERLYTIVYGFSSMTAHGRAFEAHANSKEDQFLYSQLSMALGALQGTQLIVGDWITNRKKSSRETLARILGVTID